MAASALYLGLITKEYDMKVFTCATGDGTALKFNTSTVMVTLALYKKGEGCLEILLDEGDSYELVNLILSHWEDRIPEEEGR